MGRVELHSPVLPFPIHKCWSFAPSIVHDEHCVRFQRTPHLLVAIPLPDGNVLPDAFV